MSKHFSKPTRATSTKIGAATSSVAQRQHNLGPHINLQRDASGPALHDPINKSTVTDVLQSPGQPLDASTRALMEPRFGYDFSRVRVHTDAQAARSAEAVHANAYTAGPNVVFGAGRYAPHSSQGQQLMAHELTHVVQQASGPVGSTPSADGISLSHPNDPHERSAQASAMSMHEAGPTHAGMQHGNSAPDLRPLPSAASTGLLHLQRSAADNATVASAGIAGASLGLGILGTVFAGQSAAAAGRQADAAEAASVGAATSGGLVINHADVPAATTDPNPKTLTEQTYPLLTVGIGDAINDFATIGVNLRTDGSRITGGQTETIDSNGYVGGLSGNNLFMQLRARPSPQVEGKDVVRLEYEGNNNPARHGSSSRTQHFNGAIKVDAAGKIIGEPAKDAHAHGGDPVQASPNGQPPVHVRITTPPETQ